MKSLLAEEVPLGDARGVINNPSYRGRIYWLTHQGRIRDEDECSKRGCGSGAYFDLPGAHCDGCNNWEEILKG